LEQGRLRRSNCGERSGLEGRPRAGGGGGADAQPARDDHGLVAGHHHDGLGGEAHHRAQGRARQGAGRGAQGGGGAAPEVRAPSHRLRFGAGVLLGAAAGVWLSHGILDDARREISAETEVRKATVTLQALATLAQRADPREIASTWQARTPSIAQLRIARGMQLLASSAALDKADRAAPRRLMREEKPLYDRGQRLATAVTTNREEGARKAEIEVEWLPGPRLLLAGPLEENGTPVGAIEIETVPLQPPPKAGWDLFALAVAGAVFAFAVLALLIGERRLQLSLAAAACLGV